MSSRPRQKQCTQGAVTPGAAQCTFCRFNLQHTFHWPLVPSPAFFLAPLEVAGCDKCVPKGPQVRETGPVRWLESALSPWMPGEHRRRCAAVSWTRGVGHKMVGASWSPEPRSLPGKVGQQIAFCKTAREKELAAQS